MSFLQPQIYALIDEIYKHQNVKRTSTFASQEKYPFLIEIAGKIGSRGGFGRSILSSAKSKSSSRFKDTFALTTFNTKKEELGQSELLGAVLFPT